MMIAFCTHILPIHIAYKILCDFPILSFQIWKSPDIHLIYHHLLPDVSLMHSDESRQRITDSTAGWNNTSDQPSTWHHHIRPLIFRKKFLHNGQDWELATCLAAMFINEKNLEKDIPVVRNFVNISCVFRI